MEARSFVLVSFMGTGAQEVGPSSTVSPATLTGSCNKSGTARTGTGAHVAYQHCTQQLYMLCYNADPRYELFFKNILDTGKDCKTNNAQKLNFVLSRLRMFPEHSKKLCHLFVVFSVLQDCWSSHALPIVVLESPCFL